MLKFIGIAIILLGMVFALIAEFGGDNDNAKAVASLMWWPAGVAMILGIVIIVLGWI